MASCGSIPIPVDGHQIFGHRAILDELSPQLGLHRHRVRQLRYILLIIYTSIIVIVLTVFLDVNKIVDA